jgi:GntR family transcriptional regulator
MRTAQKALSAAQRMIETMAVDARLPTPLWHQIFSQLRDAIISGRYANEAFLPSEQELSAQFHVSRVTTKRALDELAAAGMAVREQGRGTRVSAVQGRTNVRGHISGLVHSLHANGRHSVRLIDFGYVPAPEEVAVGLGLKKGNEVQRATRVWNGPHGPFSHLTTSVPGPLGRSWTRADLLKRPMISLLESQGLIVGRAQETITATLADRIVGPRLAVETGTPLLTITRTVFDTRGNALEYIVALYPPERYQYTVSLD